MKDLSAKIHQTLQKDFEPDGLELLDVISVPQSPNRMVVIKTLQEALDDFDRADDDGIQSYVVHVRSQTEKPKELTSSPDAASAAEQEQIYGDAGKLNIPFLLKNANILISAGDYGLARNIYKTVFLSGQKTADALYGLGRCYEAEGKLKEAEASFEESIAYSPQFETYSRLIGILIRNERDQYAAEVIERAVKSKGVKDASLFELHRTAGNCWLRASKITQAREHFERALKVKPDAHELQTSLGSIFLKQGEIPQAVHHFEMAIQSNPEDWRAHIGLGSCYIARGNKQSAFSSFLDGLKINPHDATAVFYLIKCAYDLKRYAEAEPIVLEYVASKPYNANLLYSLAGIQFHQGKLPQARSTAQKIIQIQAGHKGAQELIKIANQRIAESRRTHESAQRAESGTGNI